MGRVIEAKAVISAEDRTGKVLDGIAKHFREIGKGAKASVEVGRLVKQLDAAQAGLKGIDRLRSTQATFGQARAAYRSTQVEVARIAKELDSARKAASAFDGIKTFSKNGTMAKEMAAARQQVSELERQFTSVQRSVKAASQVYDTQATAIKNARREAVGSGVAVTRLVSEQVRLKAAVEGTSAAMLRQSAAERSSARLAAGMGGAGHQQFERIAAGRRVADGMGSAGRVAAADRERRAREVVEARAQRRADRVEAAGALGAGATVIAAHRSKEYAKGSIEAAAAFDLAVRKQRMSTDIGGDAQSGLMKQAQKIGQETQFSNIDVVKAQTAAMQGLPASFAPDLKAQIAEGIIGNVRNFSTLMETDLKEGTEIIRGYLQQSGKDISTKEKALFEANKATNQLTKMAKLGGMDGEDVKNFANYAMSSATASGLSTEATMSLGALARRGGLRGDVAGVAVRSMAGKIVSPTRDGIAALNAAGIKHSDFVRMPEQLSTGALEGQFQNSIGKGFTPAIRKKIDAINVDKALIADRGKYVEAVTDAVGPMLGKTKKGTVRASDSAKAAKAAGAFYKVSGQSVDAEGLLDAAMSKNMTLPQLNAWLTDKHGGKGAITQKQWDDFKSSREQIKKAGDDPDWAKKRADEVFAGLGGAVENLKGSFENLQLWIGNLVAPQVKTGADALGSGIDSLTKLPEGVAQAGVIGGFVAAQVAGVWGTLKLAKLALGLGGSTAAGAAGAAASGGAAAAGAGAGTAAAGAAGGAGAAGAAGAVMGAGVLAAGALAGGGLEMMTPGTTGGVGSLITGGESSLQQTARFLKAERAAAEAMRGSYRPDSLGAAVPKVLPGGADPAKGYASEYSASRGVMGDFLFGQEKRSQQLPGFGSGAGKTVPVEVVAMPSGSDRSGQERAIGNTLDGAAANASTAANGGKPIEATVKPDQITAKIEALPPVSGSAEVNVENHVQMTVTFDSDMLSAKIKSEVGRATASIPLSSAGARPGGISMPGAATTPGAK